MDTWAILGGPRVLQAGNVASLKGTWVSRKMQTDKIEAVANYHAGSCQNSSRMTLGVGDYFGLKPGGLPTHPPRRNISFLVLCLSLDSVHWG